MKKLFIAFSNFLPSICLAQTKPKIANPLVVTSFEEMAARIGNWLFTLGLSLAPLMILIGVFFIVTAAGDPQKIATGKRVIMYAVIGFAIIMLTNGLIALIRIILGI